jgi:hypothetical protein
MDLTELRLLRTYSDTGSLEQPQCESAGAYAHGYRGARQHPARDYAHRLTRKKPKFRQAPANFGRSFAIRGAHGGHPRRSTGRQVRQGDVVQYNTGHVAILYENRSHYYYRIGFSFLIVLLLSGLRMRMKCLRFLKRS